jgi:serine/threonine protein kinase/tetratricopeptide (TPR) repeat protein
MTEQSLPEESIFLRALDIAADGERKEYLDRACGENAKLRDEVEALLCAHRQSGDLLDLPESPDPTIESPITEKPGTQIGPYKLLQQIGEGGMGVVYMAEQEKPVRRKVALKIIKPGMDSRQVIARFEAERQALAMMDHVNIAKVLDAGATESGRPYFVMELVHGVPITEYCDVNRLTPQERLELFVPVCQAIQHAHQKGIIHRDIKPSNVLVTMYDDRPVPKVIDFGVAKAIEHRLTEKTLFTQYGSLVGTFEYMSPEQAEMNAFGVDTRSDVYSLGVLLYELLTGTTPLERTRLRESAFGEIVRLIKEEEPPRPSVRLSTLGTLAKLAESRKTEAGRLPAMVRGELDWIVMKCLEKDRTRRYDGASALTKDVQRHLAGEAVEACPPTLGYRLNKAYRKHRAAMLTAGAFAAVLLVATAVSVRFGIQATRAERQARADRDRAVTAEQSLQVKHAQALASEKKAKQEADAAGFMLDHFLTDGDNPVGNVPISVLLDRAVAELDRDKPREPLAVARIRGRIGRTYLMFGQWEAATKQLDRAQEVLKQFLGPDDLETLANQEALAYAIGSRSERGDRLLRDVLTRRRALQGPDHADVIGAMRAMGARLFIQGKREEAETFLRDALDVAVASHGDDSEEAIYCKLHLARHLISRGAADESDQLVRDVVDSAKRVFAADDPFLLTVKSIEIRYGSRKSGTPEEQEKWAEARETLFSEFVDVYGPDHPATLGILGGITQHYVSEKMFEEAEPLSRDYLERRTRVHGMDSASVQGARRLRGETLLALGRIEEAKAVLTESIDIVSKHNYGKAVYEQITLGRCFLKEKRYGEAEEHLVEGYHNLRRYSSGERISDDGRRYIEEVLHDLMAVARALSKPEEVQKWQKELDELPR